MIVDDSEQLDNDVSFLGREDSKVMYVCKITDVPIEVEIEESGIKEESHPCDLCGSHGTFSIEVQCDCGNEHIIVIEVW